MTSPHTRYTVYPRTNTMARYTYVWESWSAIPMVLLQPGILQDLRVSLTVSRRVKETAGRAAMSTEGGRWREGGGPVSTPAAARDCKAKLHQFTRRRGPRPPPGTEGEPITPKGMTNRRFQEERDTCTCYAVEKQNGLCVMGEGDGARWWHLAAASVSFILMIRQI